MNKQEWKKWHRIYRLLSNRLIAMEAYDDRDSRKEGLKIRDKCKKLPAAVVVDKSVPYYAANAVYYTLQTKRDGSRTVWWHKVRDHKLDQLRYRIRRNCGL